MIQSLQLEYPFAVYKSPCPSNTKLCIMNMAHQNPVRTIDLKNWKFVTFVSHTLMVDKKIFKLDYELNNDVMFLARKKKKLRLLCLKLNPWIESKDFRKSLEARHGRKEVSLHQSQLLDGDLGHHFTTAVEVYQTSGTIDFVKSNKQSKININQIVACQLLT
jgi:hypothetical protein